MREASNFIQRIWSHIQLFLSLNGH